MEINKKETFDRHAVYYKQILEKVANLCKRDKQSEAAQNLLLNNWENINSGQEWSARNWEESNEQAVVCMEYALTGMLPLIARLHPQKQFEWIKSGIRAAEKLNRDKEKRQLLGDIGYSLAQLGDIPQPIEYCQNALDLVRRVKNIQTEIYMLHHLALAHQTIRENDLAYRFMDESLSFSRQLGDRESTANNSVALWKRLKLIRNLSE